VADLIVPDRTGLGCGLGGFHVDPWGPAELAVITHAHGDHARPGSARYLCAAPGLELLRRRLPGAEIEALPYGERVRLGSVILSLHPAGHVLGSAQVRVESGDSVWVVSGDYKRAPDPTCAPFEAVPCDAFITEATFALPVYHWRPPKATVREIFDWWKANEAAGRASVLFGYALGKCQRILAELAALTDKPIWVHGAVDALLEPYRASGVPMLPTRRVGEDSPGPHAEPPNPKTRSRRRDYAGELILAPPGAGGSPWMRRFGPAEKFETAFASGWMRIRGIRRRMGYDRGFALSDHADWDDLLRTAQETGAKKVLATHGYGDQLARHLREQGLEAGLLPTPWRAEEEE
jgi:putative mRNA 3-end processing factor